MLRVSALVLLFGVTLLSTGCGKGSGSLKGTVTYKGQPVVLGTVTAIGKDNIPRTGLIQSDGSYEIIGLPTGSVRLAVESPDPRQTEGQLDENEKPIKPKVVKGWRKLPEKYGSVETSDLTYDVSRGSNDYDISLD